MTNVEKDIEKARKKPLPADKLRELLLKLRKNATGTLTFGKLVNVVDAINWGITGILGWVPIHYEAHGDKDALPILVPLGRFSSKEQFKAARQDIVHSAKDRLPDAPHQAGERVVMNVSQIVTNREDPRYKHFTHDEWRGSEGVVVETSSGDVSPPILYSRYDVTSRSTSGLSPNMLVHDVWRWMMSNGVDEAVAAALDMEVHVPAAERTRENTGTCPACWGNYKLEDDKLVMHGYRRPGYGYITGRCFGVGYRPVEVSKDGLDDVREQVLIPDLNESERSIEKANAGEVTQVEGRRGEVIKKGDPRFEALLDGLVRQLKQRVKHLGEEISSYDKLIKAWKIRPMPKQGELQRSMGFFLK